MHLRSGKFLIMPDTTTTSVSTTATDATTVTTSAITTTSGAALNFPGFTSTTVVTTCTTTTTTPTTAISNLFMSNMAAPSFSTPTLKLLHQAPTIPHFDGENLLQYSALQYITLCEDTMANSCITSDADKISFIRSYLTPGSLASDLMSATAFDPKALNYDYTQFRSNFLKAFGPPQVKDSFQWVHQGAEAFTTQFSQLSYLRAQSRSAQLASIAVDSLKASSWIQNGVVTEEHFRTIIEFMYYINFLNPQERRIASTLEYKQSDSLLDFATKIGTKLRDAPPSPYVASSSKPDALKQPASFLPHNQTQLRQSSSNICSYCNKIGHRVQRCFLRQRHERAAARSSSSQRPSTLDSTAQQSVSPNTGPSQDAQTHSSRSSSHPKSTTIRTRSSSRPRSSSQLSLEPPPKNCLIHGPCNHDSEECYKIKKLQREHTRTPSSSSQSNFPQGQFHPAVD